MLEKQIETKGGKFAKSQDILHLKFSSPGRAAVPDRLLLANIPEFLRPVIAKYIRFVEYKRGGEKPTPAQSREHTRLRGLGFAVDVVDSVEGAKQVMMEMKC
jgi:hypothetical protein